MQNIDRDTAGMKALKTNITNTKGAARLAVRPEME